MIGFSLKQKIFAVLGAILVIVLIITLIRIDNKPSSSTTTPKPSSSQISQNDKPQIVSTKPDPLDENIVSASEIIEITFNRSLENVGEFKVRIEPEIEYKIELSGDRKTAKIIPAKPYQLGTTYTLFIGPDSKFDGIGSWGQDKTFHFKTITYRGA